MERAISRRAPVVGRRLGQALILALVLAPVTSGSGQVTQSNSLPGYNGGTHNGADPLGNAPIPLAGPNPAKLEHLREDERHKRLAADTAKLVELTNELKADVDKASKDELSLDVVRKAAEIEKLAHDVKERMKS